MRGTVEGSSHDELTLGFRSTVVPYFVGLISLSFLSSMGFLLLFQFLDKLVQLVEACGPALAVPLDPCRLGVAGVWADS